MKNRVKTKRRSLALSHKSFTGKKIPKQYTSYPVLLFMLLCVGVLMFALTFRAQAASVTVNAIANGPPPPDPAIITSPSEGNSFTTTPINVEGTCPAGFLVRLYRNNVFSGGTLCQGDNSFVIQTDLFTGSNLLQARVFNGLDEEGPTSPAITVTYNPSPGSPDGGGGNNGGGTSNPSGGGTSNPSGGTRLPLLIKADNKLKGYYAGDTVEVPLNVSGGTAPYAVSVEWGDGNTTVVSRKADGPFTVRHVYEQGGGYKGSYVIKIRITDSNGETTFLQLTVIVKDRVELAAFSSTSLSTPSLPLKLSFKLLWPVYGLTFAMVGSFWLGEHLQYLRLRPRLK